MKRTITMMALVVAMTSGMAVAGYIGSGGVNEVRKADNINGKQYYRISCNSGGSMVLAQRGDGRWQDSGGSTISDRFDGMSVNSVANEGCQ